MDVLWHARICCSRDCAQSRTRQSRRHLVDWNITLRVVDWNVSQIKIVKVVSNKIDSSFSRPPFTSSDPLQTYHIILRGFDSIGFDQNIFSKNCVAFIRALCRENPAERLGVRGRNGFGDIKRHKWFTGFSWASLVARKLVPPIVPQLTSTIDTRYFDTVDLEANNEQLCLPKSNKPDASSGGSGELGRKSTGSGSAKRSSHSSPSESLSNRSKPASSNSDEKCSINLFDFNNNWESYF